MKFLGVKFLSGSYYIAHLVKVNFAYVPHKKPDRWVLLSSGVVKMVEWPMFSFCK